jgi:hypothetical protein
MPQHPFGQRRTYYVNFASHLLNVYNPNMLYPELGLRWGDAEWCRLIDMTRAFGFTTFEFWLEPRLFCREGLEADYGKTFLKQLNAVTAHARSQDMDVEMIAGLATVGSDWYTCCPNDPEEWAEVEHLWSSWLGRLPNVSIVGIFPGDPGACARNGCTAMTFIDKSLEVAGIARRQLPKAEIELHTWGPPFFGWGLIEGPQGGKGEFHAELQGTAWRFDPARSEKAMQHLLERLPDFPEKTAVAINMGFNPDGEPAPGGDAASDARAWAGEIAKTNRILTWDFSLTEGENAILPHCRLRELYAKRRAEREAAPYSGGICFTMTPLLSQLSAFAAARSFVRPDDQPGDVARSFLQGLFGTQGRALAEYLPLFEVVPDWGNHERVELPLAEYHRSMRELLDLLSSLKATSSGPFHPEPEAYRKELIFFARLFRDMSSPIPDYDELRQRYWYHVYRIYDRLPAHVDPRPARATDGLVDLFRRWHEKPARPGTPPAGPPAS